MDNLLFFNHLSQFCLLLIEYHCSFSISCKRIKKYLLILKMYGKRCINTSLILKMYVCIKDVLERGKESEER